MELEIKREEKTINGTAEKIELLFNTKMVQKKILHKFVGEDV